MSNNAVMRELRSVGFFVVKIPQKKPTTLRRHTAALYTKMDMTNDKIISTAFLISFVSPLGTNFRLFDDMSITIEAYAIMSGINFLFFWLAYGIARVISLKKRVNIGAMPFAIVYCLVVTVLWFALMAGGYIGKGVFWVFEWLFKLSIGSLIILLLLNPWLGGVCITKRSS